MLLLTIWFASPAAKENESFIGGGRHGQQLNEKARMNVDSLSVATERYVQLLPGE